MFGKYQAQGQRGSESRVLSAVGPPQQDSGSSGSLLHGSHRVAKRSRSVTVAVTTIPKFTKPAP